jgi:hypothetical protein
VSDITITFTASSYSELLQQIESFSHELKTFGQGEKIQETPKAAPGPAPTKAAEPKEDGPEYTVEQLRAEAVKLPTVTMRAILDELGEKKLSSVPAKKYPEVMAKIQEAL